MSCTSVSYNVSLFNFLWKSWKIIVKKTRQKEKIQIKSQLKARNIWLMKKAWCSIGFYLSINQCTQIKSKGLILSFVVCQFKDWTWKVHSLLKEIKKTSSDILIFKRINSRNNCSRSVVLCKCTSLSFLEHSLDLHCPQMESRYDQSRTGYYKTVNET